MRVAVVHNRDASGVINVFGPQNRERYNPRTVERVARALEAGGHTVRVIDGNMHVIERLQDFMPRVISGERPGMVFNMAYGIQGVSRYTHLPAMLEMLGVPYVGSGPQAHGMALDKVIAKIMFQAAGLPTAKFWNFASPDDQFEDLVCTPEHPLIVKPKMEAVSYGIRIVDNEGDLREAVATIVNEFGQHVLVEQFVAGRELAIGLLGNGDPEVLPIVEIDLEGDPNAIQTDSDKLRSPRGKLCPAPLTDEQTADLQELAKRAFRSLELYDFARVDLRLDADNTPYILEINSMASLGLTGTYTHAAQVAGYTYEAMVNRMLDVAAIRYFGAERLSEAEGEEKAAPRASNGDRPRTRLLTHIRSSAATIEDNVQRLVETRTPTEAVDRVNQLGDWLVRQLEALDFRVERLPRVGLGDSILARNHIHDEDDVLLLAHLDTGAPVTEWAPYRADDRRIFGTGAAESKGGIAVALAALRGLRHIRRLRQLRVAILLTSDGAGSGAGGRQLIENAASRARNVIGLKAGDPGGALISARAGERRYYLESAFRRQQREVSAERVVRHSANRMLALQELSTDLPTQSSNGVDADSGDIIPSSGIHAHITQMRYDAGGGRLPSRAEAELTVRYTDPEAGSVIDEKVERIANARTTPGVRMHLSARPGRPALRPTERDGELLETIARVAESLSQKAPPEFRWASADIGFAPESAARIDGMGPIGGAARTDDEYILRHSLVERATLLALTILELRSKGSSRRGRRANPAR